MLPEEQPNIEGDVADHYRVGDMVNLNCTAAPSIPAAILVWYINDKEVSSMALFLHWMLVSCQTDDSLQYASVGHQSCLVKHKDQ